MKYNDVVKYLESLWPKDFRMELIPIIEACQLFDNPQNSFASVHIAGTNGKGSTSAFLADILKGNGYKVGLYTSPHLVDVRERIQVNREMISKDDLAAIVTKIKDDIPNERMLSFFEMMSLVAFMHFKNEKVDIAVIETGLGGRFDATNVITPKVSIITPIAHDHTLHLGNSLRDIALEKSGIIKRGVPTVVAYQVPEVMDVIRHVCDDIGSPLCLAAPDEITSPLGLAGEHQKQNAACAVEAAHLLSQIGFKVAAIEKPLENTTWPGRLETVSAKPKVILDAAHNPSGAEMLASYVRAELKRDKSVLILGVLADKDVTGIIRPLAPLFKKIVCVKAPSPRSASPKDLAAAARSSGAEISVVEDTSKAIAETLKTLSHDDVLIISGSVTVVGEAKKYFTGKA